MTSYAHGNAKSSATKSPTEAWGELIELSADASSAVTLNWWKGGLILANLSISKIPELVIQLNGYSLEAAGKRPSSVKVAGLDIWYESLTFNGARVPSLVLMPKYTEHFEVFYSLADHLVSNISQDENLEVSPENLEERILDWVKFWSRERPEFNKELLLGLLGELIAIDDVLDLDGYTHEFWEGPKGSPQDFRGSIDALEVKVQGTHTGPITHQISSILQLQIPTSGNLYVLSLRIKLGANGENSFHDIVERVRANSLFANREGKEFYSLALEKVGYSAELPINLSRYDVVDLGIYHVREGFPRLIHSLIPDDPRIFDVKYSVDFSGAQEFLLEKTNSKLKLK